MQGVDQFTVVCIRVVNSTLLFFQKRHIYTEENVSASRHKNENFAGFAFYRYVTLF